MADNQWKGDQPATVKIVTITVAGTPAAGNTAKIAVGGQTVTHTLPASPNAITVAAALYALVTASSVPPQFNDVSWSYTAGTAVLSGANGTDGYPVMISVSVTGGGVTLTLGGDGDLLCTGPNDVANVLNWSLGHLPTTGERAVIRGGSDMLYNLDTGLVGCVQIEVYSEFSGGKGGLPDRSSGSGGQGYVEYRPQFIKLAAAAEATIHGGVSRFRLTFNGAAGIVNVYGTSDAADSDTSAVEIQSPNSVAQVGVYGGTVSLNRAAMLTGSTFAVINVNGGALTINNGVPYTTLNLTDGTVTAEAGGATLNIKGGTYTQVAGPNSYILTLNSTGGIAYLDHGQLAVGSGSIQLSCSAPSGQPSPVVDCSRTNNIKESTDGSGFTGGGALLNQSGALRPAGSGTMVFDQQSLLVSRFKDYITISSM